ncbi:MAG TPA: uroporphyrinogen decarboxylase family protein [Armatimonadota bacterium]|jgi:MtaA/CmuA family methyltransferase
MTSRERVMAHLRGEPVDHLPFLGITMRFAATRAGAKYLDYETKFQVLADAQIGVAEQFALDYVNTMSDPGIEAEDCGATIIYYDDEPAGIDHTRSLLEDKARLVTLLAPSPTSGRMLNRIQAVSLLKERVGSEKMVEGWVEGPCAEGADLRGINTLMMDFLDDPSFVRDLFEFVIDLELSFAKEQVAAGADVIGIGDAAASLVGPRIYREFVWPYEKRLVDGIHEMGAAVRLHICGNTSKIAGDMAKLGCEILDVDFLCPLGQARKDAGPDQIFLGNVDPVRVLEGGTPEDVYAGVDVCHREAGPRFIVAPGCEITRATPPANFLVMARYAQEHTP